jgi:hypothetical protein
MRDTCRDLHCSSPSIRYQRNILEARQWWSTAKRLLAMCTRSSSHRQASLLEKQ